MKCDDLTLDERGVLSMMHFASRPTVFGPCPEAAHDASRVYVLQEVSTARAYASLIQRGLVKRVRDVGLYTSVYELTEKGRKMVLEVIRGVY